MQKMFRLLPIALCFLLLLNSCSKSSENARYVSKDAICVASINTLEIGKKVAWNVLSGSPLLQEMSKMAGGDSSNMDLQKTGVDFLNSFFVYAMPDQRFNGGSRFVCVIPLKDAEKFKIFIKEKFPEVKFETKGKLFFAYLNNNACIGWNNKTAIAAYGAPPAAQWQEDNNSPQKPENVSILLTEEIQKTFDLPSNQSLLDNNKFASLMKEAHDISFWLNYEVFANSLPQETIGTAGAVLASQKKLLKDAYIAASLDFEKGKIKGDATYYFNSSMKAIAEAVQLKKTDNSLLKKVPGTQMNLLMSYHFDPKGLKALADTMGVLPMANLGLKEFGITIDEVLNAFSGDFLLSITDFMVKTESKSYNMNGSSVNYTSPIPSFKATLSFKIKDKTAFNKLMQSAVQREMLSSTGSNFYQAGPFISIATNDEYVAISNESATASAFLSSSTKTDWKVPTAITNNPYGFYVDIKNSIKSLPLDLLYGKEDTAVFQDARKLMESISAYGGKVEGNQSSFHFEALFQNKEENSLMQLINFSQKVAAAEQKQADSYDDVVPEEDSTTTDTATEAI